jgi:hypothetical protein
MTIASQRLAKHTLPWQQIKQSNTRTIRDGDLYSVHLEVSSVHGLKQAEGSVEIKQRPIKMGGRTTYWTLPPKRAPFQNGIDR